VGQLLLSLAQLAIAVVLSAVIAYLALFLFQWFTRGLDEWQALRQGNAAVGIVLGAILVSVAIVLRPALVVDSTYWDVGRALFFRLLLIQAFQLMLGLVFAVGTLFLALLLFATLTRGIDEVQELQNGNLAVATLVAGVVIAVGLMVSQATAQVFGLLSSLLL
jgi:uncharacterized membrane protein YjfL (UPF0719 family)